MQKYQSIYDRFGYQIEEEKIYKAFNSFIINEFWDSFIVLIKPKLSKEERINKVEIISDDVFKDICRATCIDPTEYRDDNSFELNPNKKIWYLINFLFKYKKGKTIEIYVFLQIIVNIIYSHKDIRHLLENFISEINAYLYEFPLLGIIIKTYKTKGPQVFPIISKAIDNKINLSLNTLEDKNFTRTIAQFEDGLKQFLSADGSLSFKNVIEDMRGSCDELIKEILKNKNKGMKSIFGSPEYETFGLSPGSKKIFEEFMNRMDDLKHGKKDISKQDTIMIIGMTADFIQFISSSYTKI